METTSKESTSLERRWSIRQMEGAYRLKEMMVRKCEGYVHLVLGSESKNRSCFKNSFNPNMISELTLVLKNLMSDDSLVVLISGSGNTFSAGVDLHYLLHGESDRRIAARNMATHLKELVSVLIAFPKPLIAAVNGAASGLAVAMLPLLDLVYASDKASFSCPYVDVGQTPEACSSYTFQKIMGPAMANELLIRGRKVTALEAHQIGLVTQVFWPENFMSEVTPRVQNFAHLNTKVLTSTKMLMRHHKRAKLETVNEAECQHLIDCWSSSRTQSHMKAYIERHNDWLAG
ncbi:hypothetical protein HELRODRAFT_72040 [Helobdella robusta]|uniref:Uncharacterized protein n=1 Tax=Helobdella robusta TaxID=6412 RepID=T1G0U5_HELRO|nr:hypothetical protein HELRODRAFT_72040 [Helobdella robusta]ESO10854.1 hypothetical protein HELRODRAFT_72040 [Helobdella robusta]